MARMPYQNFKELPPDTGFRKYTLKTTGGSELGAAVTTGSQVSAPWVGGAIYWFWNSTQWPTQFELHAGITYTSAPPGYNNPANADQQLHNSAFGAQAWHSLNDVGYTVRLNGNVVAYMFNGTKHVWYAVNPVGGYIVIPDDGKLVFQRGQISLSANLHLGIDNPV